MDEKMRVFGRRATRREVLTLGGAGATGLLLAACGGMGGNYKDSGANASTKGPWTEPPVVRSSGGVLEQTLIIAGGKVAYGDGSRWAITVNGTTPGPTLRVKPGDTLKLTLENRLEHSTNLHTHGLHVSPSGKSDNPFVEVKPGEKFAYEIAIPKEHPGGLFWYHPHLHHHSAEQLFAGFMGAIIVEDDFDAKPEVAAAKERLLVISDAKTSTREATVMGATMMEKMEGREGPVVLVNGKPLPTLETPAGSLERWRIVNASASRFYRLKLDGHKLSVVSSDVGRYGAATEVDSLLLVPGERTEVFVRAETPGEYSFATEAVDRHAAGMGMGMGMSSHTTLSGAANLLKFVVTGAAAKAALAPSGTMKGDDLSKVKVDGSREITLVMNGMTFMIDGQMFDPDRVDSKVKLGSVEEWTITNSSNMDHPFHLHAWPFQLMSVSNGQMKPGWKDVVNVPAGGWAKFRVKFADFGGKSVYHCHILDHEDAGMMAIIEVA